MRYATALISNIQFVLVGLLYVYATLPNEGYVHPVERAIRSTALRSPVVIKLYNYTVLIRYRDYV